MERPQPFNKWRDTVPEELPPGEMFFLLLSRGKGDKVWYVEYGPQPLWVIRSREKVIRDAGIDTRVIRCVALGFDPSYAGLVPCNSRRGDGDD